MSTVNTRAAIPLPLMAAVLYFSEGLPWGIVNELLPLYLRLEGVSLGSIGLLSSVSLAWTIKVFWSPLIDRFGSYRGWILSSILVLAASFASLSLVDPRQQAAFWLAVTLIALASATQDMAVDAYTIAVTPVSSLGIINSIRVAAYRGAVIVAGGGLAAVASRYGWPTAFRVAAILSLIVLAVASLTSRPKRQSGSANPFTGLKRWFTRTDSLTLLALVLLYKLGDVALSPMIKPYWVDRGYSAAEIGTVTTVIGMSFTIMGALAGGAFIARFGIPKALLWLGILQMLSNVGYASVATLQSGTETMYAAAVTESFTGGLGTAAFLSFLMAACDRRFAATEFAILTAIFGLSRSVAGSLSGFAAQNLGYATFFWITVALGIPALLLVRNSGRFVRPAEESVNATGES